MTQIGTMPFQEVWIVDTEFHAPPGERPEPICLVARKYPSGQTIRLQANAMTGMDHPPFAVGEQSLFVAFYASAELGCFLSLGWPIPINVLDLFVEFRNLTNGIPTPSGAGLLGALVYFGLDGAGTVEKDSMRNLAIRGGPWTKEEQAALLDYCESDVLALTALLTAMESGLDMERALLRGRYMAAVARIEYTGTPVDQTRLTLLRDNWETIQDKLIKEIDKNYKVFDGRTFKMIRFQAWLAKNKIPWPYHPSGHLDLGADTFKEMAKTFPEVAPLRELRASLSQMRLAEIAVGQDFRNRCMLSAFRARTGRNQPSNSRFIFGPSKWLRSLIQPKQGYGLAYIDWSQQEFGIAAALSGDTAMMDAYTSGDPYLAFAKQAGAVPESATKKTHKTDRNQFKACVLAVQYGMGEVSLASRIGQPVSRARELLRLHRQTYQTFWNWSDSVVDHAMLKGKLWTTFGWTIRVGIDPNPRFLRNFPMQANGAEMLRLACCFATEQGIRVCAPIHDAILIEASLEDLQKTISTTQKIMQEVSSIVLNGFTLRSDVDTIRYPDRYVDEQGGQMWDTIWQLI